MTRNGSLAVVVVVALAGCTNAGEDRVLSISSTGVVSGFAYLDRNGNRALDAADTALSNLGVRIVTSGTRDTAGRTNSGSSGSFRFAGVPVGTYDVVIDTTMILGDSLRVTRIDTSVVTIRPNDTLPVGVAVGFPQVSIEQARSLAVGRKAFLAGVVLYPRGIFGDTTLGISDGGSSIRLTGVRTVATSPGDSVRVLGIRAVRDGQPTMNQVTVLTLALDAELPMSTVTSTVAATADGGRLDAAFVRVLNVLVEDTATVLLSRNIRVDDASGDLTVRLERTAGFQGFELAGDTVGARFDVYGILVPTGSGGWQLKPRGPTDLVPR